MRAQSGHETTSHRAAVMYFRADGKTRFKSLALRLGNCHHFAMNLDIEDVFAGVFGSILGRALLFLLAVWLGCSIGAAGSIVGAMLLERAFLIEGLHLLWASPILIFSVWGLLNIPFLLFAFIYFIRSEDAGFRAWGIIVGVESLMVMAGWASYFAREWLPITAAWLTWALLLTMVETGVWLIYQAGVNAWARDIGTLRAANAQRRAQRESEEDDRIHHSENVVAPSDLADSPLLADVPSKP
jgi:hypothetical protein